MEIVKGIYFLQELLKEEALLFQERKRYPLLLVFSHPGEGYLGEEDEAFLEKVLTAVDLKLTEVKMINTFKKNYLFENWDEIPSEKIIFFGAEPEDFFPGLQLENYQLKSSGGVRLLKAEALSTIQADKDKKTSLWNALKRLFILQ